ncbi:COX15/CtaA family protein [uncultured Agrococcus sp.]|uniref:COX15/CtaA family protein n=1 Tax=uncultured Agrococcus sp. TaxID=382258 RepID=UPI0025FDD370|nr:COX15/CtaA family protein [uncultured Agrococcus sp.]
MQDVRHSRTTRIVAALTLFGKRLTVLTQRRISLFVFAWVSFVAEVTIIGTGGAVRLTGSGLGCSDWPMCTPESLVPLPEQGIHGVIEFGNRLMTGVVGIAALAVLLLTWRHIHARRELITTGWFALGSVLAATSVYVVVSFTPAEEFTWVAANAVLLAGVVWAAISTTRTAPGRRDLVVLAWVVFSGVIAQALVGGITVLTGLNPWIVGFHYTSSLLLVCVTAAYLVRFRAVPRRRTRAVPGWFAGLTHITGFFLAATISFGVLTTASGPHSGDANVIRDGFDATFMSHVHAWPGYLLAVLVVALVIAAWSLRLPPLKWLLVLAVAIVVQIVVGVWQARDGLPPLLVGIHMVLAALSAAAYTVVAMRLKIAAAATNSPAMSVETA